MGPDAGDYAGWSVSSAGDINGDGFDDLMVGARKGDGAADGTPYAGEAIVIFGKAAGFDDIDVSAPDFVSSGAGFRIFGADAGDYAGWSASSAGDINGDGFDDLIVGADRSDGAANAKGNSGEAIVIFGGNLTGSVVFAGTSGANTLTGTAAAETFVGGQGNDILTGGGGADSFSGGSGNDTITVADLAFRKVDGGSGTDTLVFSGTAQTIDFTLIANNRVTGIEEFDVTGAESHKRLVVRGDAGDTLDLRDFDPDGGAVAAPYEWQLTDSAKNLTGTGVGNFNFYNLMRDSDVVASVAVDADMFVL